MSNTPKEAATKKKVSSGKSTSSESKSTSTKSNEKAAKKTKKKIEKIAKKNPLGIVIIFAFLILGAVGGYIVGANMFSNVTNEYAMKAYDYSSSIKNVNGETAKDLYYENEKLENDSMVVLLLGDVYNEPGVSCIYKNKEYEVSVEYYYREDISYDPELVENIDTNRGGFYYAKYSSSCEKYKSIDLIRTIYVMEVENDG